jgi:hypothetical protein
MIFKLVLCRIFGLLTTEKTLVMGWGYSQLNGSSVNMPTEVNKSISHCPLICLTGMFLKYKMFIFYKFRLKMLKTVTRFQNRFNWSVTVKGYSQVSSVCTMQSYPSKNESVNIIWSTTFLIINNCNYRSPKFFSNFSFRSEILWFCGYGFSKQLVGCNYLTLILIICVCICQLGVT